MAESTNWLLNRIQESDERPFIVCDGPVADYRELDEKIDEFESMLTDAGVKPGAIVGLIADFGLASTAALLALIKNQCVVVPVAKGLPTDQVEVRWEESRVDWIWDLGESECGRLDAHESTSDQYDLIKQLVANQEPGLILFSSGSAGKPKAMVQDMSKLIDVFRKRKPRKLRILSFLLFDHIGGINTLLNAIATGAMLVVPGSRNPESVAQLIEQHAVHMLPTSPTFLNLLLMSGAHERFDLSSLKIITYGTEPMPAGLLARLKDVFPRTRLLQTFGTSETGISQTSSLSSSSTLMKFDDPNLEYKIVEGELWLRSQTQIQGYLNHSNERFTDDGWFKTGDQVEQSSDGFLRIVGRRSEMINVGGEKVTPSEVEGVLLEIPEILDCLVYGQTNAITGQNVAVDLLLAESADEKKIKREVRKRCRSKLEPYKVPTRIKIVPQTEFSERFKKQRIKQ